MGMERKLTQSDRYFQEALRLDPENVSIRLTRVPLKVEQIQLDTGIEIRRWFLVQRS